MALHPNAKNSIARTTVTDQYGSHISSEKGLDVITRSPIETPIDFRLNRQIRTGLTLAVPAVKDSYELNLSPGHGVSVGELLILVGSGGAQTYNGEVIGVVGDTVTMDTPIHCVFIVAGTSGYSSSTSMNVNGSSTRLTYSLINNLNMSANIVRIIMHITSASPMDDGKFGSLVALTKGIVFRRKNLDGNYQNFWNAKSNGRLGELAYDKTYDTKAPAGVYGMTVRLTYGGESKHGTVIQILPGEELHMLIQDDLTGLVEFNTICQGFLTTT